MIGNWFHRVKSVLLGSRAVGAPVTHIYISGWRGDFEFTKCCVASIRHWYPDIPISLIKDCLHGDYDTRALEQAFDVRIFPSTRRGHGFGAAKLEPLFQEHTERCLILDSDIVFLGPVLARLERFPQDFVVTLENHTLSHICECYYNPQELRELDPDFVFPGYAFNTGQITATTGLLRRGDFEEYIAFEDPPRVLRPEIFKCGEQGLLNFVLLRLKQQGRITLARTPFTNWPPGMQNEDVDLDRLRSGEGYNMLLHWAGFKQYQPATAPLAHVLRYFLEIYNRKTEALQF